MATTKTRSRAQHNGAQEHDLAPQTVHVYRRMPVAHVNIDPDATGDLPFEAAVLHAVAEVVAEGIVRNDGSRVFIHHGIAHDQFEAAWEGRRVTVTLGDAHEALS